jgi:hypothetical protein
MRRGPIRPIELATPIKHKVLADTQRCSDIIGNLPPAAFSVGRASAFVRLPQGRR